MILESIKLKNFGVYGGNQEPIMLAPEDERHPIVLFGGMNGGGKTTLLDAVQLVLYGPRAKCSGRGKLAYKDYLRAMIHRGADVADGAGIELRFRRTVDGEVHYYRVTRAWRDGARGVEEHLEVRKDADLDVLLSEHWDEFIEGYIPSGISHLFFFDAEQIKDLAEREHAAEILGTAIHTLLGLDLVDRLETDLIALERRKRAEAKTGEELDRVHRAWEEVERMEGLLREAQVQRDAIHDEAKSVGTKLERKEYKFRQEGGDLFLLRSELEAQKQELLELLNKERGELKRLAAGSLPLVLVPQMLEEAEKVAEGENEQRKAQGLLVELEKRDKRLLDKLKGKKLSLEVRNTVKEILGEDLETRRTASQNKLWLNGSEEFPTELRHLRTNVLPDVTREVEERLASILGLEERRTHLDMELGRVPAEAAIAELQRELEQLRKEHQRAQAELAAHDEKIHVMNRQLEDATRKYKQELGSEVDVQMTREHVDRVIRHSARVRETLGKFRIAVIRKHAERLERLVLESFTSLLRKKSLVGGLRIDPATFQLELTGGDGKALPFDRLSAGERQLLATSMLWGLAKASGRPLPTIIDTPLGRLDSSHRRHLLERYFPVASHQVILLSTDEEIDEANLQQLKPYIGRSYYLKFDESTRSSVAAPGYFWNHETTR